MKIQITPARINKREENQVTSSQIFKKNQRRVSSDYKYDENGLLSRKIFGRIGSCDCGNLKTPGFCKACGCRVVDEKNMPEFFIDLGIFVPKLYSDYGDYKDVKPLLEYTSFLYTHEDGTLEIIHDDASLDIDPDTFDASRISIGVEAALKIHPDMQPWIDKYMTDFISVPHTLYRANLKMDNNKIIFSPINKALITVLQNIERVNQYKTIFEEGGDETDAEIEYFLLALYAEVYKQYIVCMKEIFNIFCNGKGSFVGSDMRSHRVTSAIKGTVVNRFDLDEDVILIGDTFVQTLYPYLYHRFDGDMEKINDYLIANEERVIMNRPPTICHLSIVGMKPRIASCYKFGTFNDGALGPNKQSEYCEENDTIGIRTVAVNPIITDGLNLDYDGDCILVISIFSKKAKEEVDSMLPSKNFMNYANGKMRNVIPEDISYVEGK